MNNADPYASVPPGTKPIIAALTGKALAQPPFWLMRQAGRYLPEYREVRAKAGSFLDLVYAPELAAEVTMQPLRRFGMDAAILFSDILVVPHALGCKVWFADGEGPKLEALDLDASLPVFDPERFNQVCKPVYDTVAEIRNAMQREAFSDTGLIGFAGSPWTVACYMAEGGGSRDFHAARRSALSRPDVFGRLVDTITDATIFYLKKQVEAGAEILQLFDSWAGLLGEDEFRRWVIAPTRRIVSALKVDCPNVPVVGFPRGAGLLTADYARETGVDAVSLDHTVPLSWARDTIQPLLPVQGNLDPMCLLAGGPALDRSIDSILAVLAQRPFVFNLGHGIHKDTPPGHVAQLTARLRGMGA